MEGIPICRDIIIIEVIDFTEIIFQSYLRTISSDKVRQAVFNYLLRQTFERIGNRITISVFEAIQRDNCFRNSNFFLKRFNILFWIYASKRKIEGPAIPQSIFEESTFN